MKYFRIALLAIAPLPLLIGNAFAETVYEKLWNGDYSNSASSMYPGFPGGSAGQQVADDFTLTSNETVRSVTWQGFTEDLQGNVPGGQTSAGFKIRLFTDNAGKPSLNPFYDNDVSAIFHYSGTSFTLPQGNSYDLFKYEANIPDASLNSGEKYWISIMSKLELLGPNNTVFDWAASTSGTSDWRASGEGDGSAWRDVGLPDNRVFSLNNSPTVTPEPASMALFGLGAGALALAKRKKKLNKRVQKGDVS